MADEIVNWFNAVDATYRSDLRDLNELNVARFDAKLEQRLVALEARWEQRLALFETKLDRGLGELRVEIARQKADILKWMFTFWALPAVAVIGLLLR